MNAEVYFERTGGTCSRRIRAKRPQLVVFDLDSVKLRPIETVAAMKADPDAAVAGDPGLRVARPRRHHRGGARRRHRSGAGALGVRRPARRHPHLRGKQATLASHRRSHQAAAARSSRITPTRSQRARARRLGATFDFVADASAVDDRRYRSQLAGQPGHVWGRRSGFGATARSVSSSSSVGTWTVRRARRGRAERVRPPSRQHLVEDRPHRVDVGPVVGVWPCVSSGES